MSSSQPTLLDAVGLVGFPKTLPGDGRPITSFCLLIFMYATLSVVLNIGLLPSSPSSIMHDAEGGLRTSLLAHESKNAASTIARAQDSQSVMSDESSAMSALRPRNDAASIVRHQFPVFNDSSMPVQIFLVTTALWSLWFPSILSLPVMLHAMLSFTTVGLQVRESLISTKTLRVILLYMACLYLVYSGFSTPYVYEYVTLGCSSQHQENATAKPCSRDAILGLKPERWATLWGVGWAIPSSLDR